MCDFLTSLEMFLKFHTSYANEIYKVRELFPKKSLRRCQARESARDKKNKLKWKKRKTMVVVMSLKKFNWIYTQK